MEQLKDMKLPVDSMENFNWAEGDDTLSMNKEKKIEEGKETLDTTQPNNNSVGDTGGEGTTKTDGTLDILNSDLSPNTLNFEHAIHLASRYFNPNTEVMTYQVWVESVKKILDIGKRYSKPYIPSCEQYRALLTTAKRVLIDACPGSGKTATLMNKIFLDGQIRDRGSKQLGITYTRAAANSLAETYTAICRRYKQQNTVDFGTIHALAYQVERGVSECEVLTPEGINKVIQTTYYDDEDFSFDLYEDDTAETIFIHNQDIITQAVESLGLGRSYLAHLSSIEGWINVVAERMIETQDELLRLEEFNDLEYIKLDDLNKIGEMARNIRQSHDVVDFTDMLVNFHERIKNIDSLEDIGDASLKYNLTYDHIYVDEFQDISPRQWEIISELLRLNPHAKLYCVGDADQAVYSFRGADSKFLVEFKDSVIERHGVIEEDIDIMYFTINRRSGKDIVDLTSDLIQKNKYRYDKQIHSFEEGRDSNIRLIIDPTSTAVDTRSIILNDIQEIKRRDPDKYNFSDVGILYREHQQSFMLMVDMINQKIPVNLQSKYFPSNFAEVKDILNIWAMLMDSGNPYRLENYLYKCMQGINKQRASVVAGKVRQTGRRFSDFLDTPEVGDLRVIYQDLLNGNMEGAIEKTCYKYFASYLKLFPARHWKLDVAKYYLSTWKDLTRANLIKEHERVLEYMDKNYGNIYGVQFKTMHSSKGLEYNDVYILPIGDNVMPKKKMMDKMSKKHMEEYVEEERRLLYVALSRSKRNLTVFVDKLTDKFPAEVYASHSKVMMNKTMETFGEII